MTATWYPASSADKYHDDVEVDLGNGWWAGVTQGAGVWHWTVSDHWLLDEDDSEAANGVEATQDAAKAAALAAASDRMNLPTS